jgi:hypothetical protein
MANTGTPWAAPAHARSVMDTVFHFAGGYWDPGLALGLMYFALMALGVWGASAGAGLVAIDLRRRGPGRALAVVVFGTLLLAVIVGQVTQSAFAVRYAAILFPFLILLVALGVDVLEGPALRMGVLAAAAFLGFAATLPNASGDRTSAGRVAAALRKWGAPGDVVAYCPDQLGPSVSRLLPDGRYAQLTFPRARGPQLVDWVGYEEANRDARTAPFARMLVDRAGPDRSVWVVWAPGYRTFGTKCQMLLSSLEELRPGEDRVVRISGRYFERPGLVEYPPG